MKVIFLDFDGCVNSWRYFKDSKERMQQLGRIPKYDIDPKAVNHLNKVIARTGAKVVISSTWRLIYSVDELQAMLDARGFKGEVIGRTPELKTIRGAEIEVWLSQHLEVTRFVIFDDGDDMGNVRGNLVLIDARKGLKPKHVEAAIKLLEESC